VPGATAVTRSKLCTRPRYKPCSERHGQKQGKSPHHGIGVVPTQSPARKIPCRSLRDQQGNSTCSPVRSTMALCAPRSVQQRAQLGARCDRSGAVAHLAHGVRKVHAQNPSQLAHSRGTVDLPLNSSGREIVPLKRTTVCRPWIRWRTIAAGWLTDCQVSANSAFSIESCFPGSRHQRIVTAPAAHRAGIDDRGSDQ